MSVRRIMSAVALVILVLAVTAFAGACGGGDGDGRAEVDVEGAQRAPADVQEPEGGAEEVSLDDFVFSASFPCSGFAARQSPANPLDPASYEYLASALAELALPSDAAERKRAEALVEAMEGAAIATRELSSATEEYVDPGMRWLLTEGGNVYQYEETIYALEPVADFPTPIGLRTVEALEALEQVAAGLGLEECVPPEGE